MKRCLLIFLLMLLPLQFSWAVAGNYCAHEEGAAARHIGHHVHKHDAQDSAGGAGSQDSSQPIKADADCEYCHHVSASALCAAAQAHSALPPCAHAHAEVLRYMSHIPDLIPRPDWPAAA